jgi:hypothetical protein
MELPDCSRDAELEDLNHYRIKFFMLDQQLLKVIPSSSSKETVQQGSD